VKLLKIIIRVELKTIATESEKKNEEIVLGGRGDFE
jgi:hypothetical protein